jgi:hypothetical protein
MSAATGMDIFEIAARGNEFWPKLQRVKEELNPTDFSFYPYESLGTFDHLRAMLDNERGRLLDLAAGAPILDIGAGDGDSSFFLESLGCKVVAVDNPATNWNAMQGIRLLKQALNSSVDIQVLDLDSQFTLGETGFGLTLLLGVLYHLQNPFYVLSKLARNSRYCLLSTRVARYSLDRRVELHQEPVGYLVDAHETNNDATNYWIFSEAGLKRLINRTKWTLCDYMTVGNQLDSDPITAAGDERAYALLKSEVFHGPAILLDGWHLAEGDGWRWVAGNFSARFDLPAGPRRDFTLTFRFALPQLLFDRLGPITVQASAQHDALPAETYSRAGDHVYIRRVATAGGAVQIDFKTDKWLAGDETDARDRALIAVSLDLA